MPKKPHPNKCATLFCRNLRYKARRSRFCTSCISRKYTEKRPLAVAYYNLRKSAKRRGIEFTITLAYFTRFCIKYDYASKRGRSASSATVDRKDATKGYVPGNLQWLSMSDNSRKNVLVDRLRIRKAMYVEAKIRGHAVPVEEADPF